MSKVRGFRLACASGAVGLGLTAVAPAKALVRPTPVTKAQSTPASGTAIASATSLPGFDGPIIGHSGFRNLPIFLNTSEEADVTNALDAEVEMGATWTFTAAIWALFEPHGPTSAANDPTGAWLILDKWISAAHDRGLNVLVQPVMSTNGGTPPAWAGHRVPANCGEAQTWTDPWGASFSRGDGCGVPGPANAPSDMNALASWYSKLVQRYRPGGDLAQAKGWTDGYGVRAWEVDNEPDDYGLWYAEIDDYAEVFTRAAAAIHAADPDALVVGPGASGDADDFLRGVLDKRMQAASLDYKLNGQQFAIGPLVDVLSMHHYDAAPGGASGAKVADTVARQLAWWNLYANFPGQPEFAYSTAKPLWHTEGNPDYAGSSDGSDPGLLSRTEPEFLVKGFAAGFDKMTVQDLQGTDQYKIDARRAIRTLVTLLPDAASLERVTADGTGPQVFVRAGTTRIFVAWSGTDQTQTYTFPISGQARVLDKYGNGSLVTASGGSLTVTLPGAPKASEPVYVVEQ